MGLYDASGRAPLPGEDALVVDSYESSIRNSYLPLTYDPDEPDKADEASQDEAGVDNQTADPAKTDQRDTCDAPAPVEPHDRADDELSSTA